MTLREIGEALEKVVPNCHHYNAHKQKTPYLVWAEDGQADSGHGDNRMITQVVSGTVDYFTKNEYDPKFYEIQKALNSLDIAWRLNSVQYEGDTGYIHYEWAWEAVICADG